MFAAITLNYLGIQNTIAALKSIDGILIGIKVEVYLSIYREEENKKAPQNMRDFSNN